MSDRHERSSLRPQRVVAGLLPTFLVAAAMFNIATFRPYAQAMGDRWGFRPGQSADVADRIRASGNTLLREGWHLHLRVGELVGPDPLVLPDVSHPLDERLLTYMAQVDWRLEDETTISVERAQELVERDDVQIWANEDGTSVALVPAASENPDTWILVNAPGTVGDPAVRWLVVPGTAAEGAQR